MKFSTLILIAGLAIFVWAPDSNGHSIFNDFRQQGLDLASACELRLPLGE